MRFALMIEPQQGLSYQDQVQLTLRAESAGFETLYRSDHYQSLPGPEGRETSDAWVVIAGLVRESDRIRHGTLVSPVTFRHPGNLAKVVATIDHMSAGRVELGLGIGWHEGEHQQHGFAFPDLPTRVEMLEEQLGVINGLWYEPDGWRFTGKHYRVDGARFAPRPVQKPRLPIIVGTRGARAAIRLAARHADELNLYYVTADAARTAFRRLDDECRAIGRDPGSIVRSVLLGTAVGSTDREASQRFRAVLSVFEFAGSRTEWEQQWGELWMYGTPADAEATVRRFGEAGADRIIFQDFLFEDRDLIDLLGELAAQWSSAPNTLAIQQDA